MHCEALVVASRNAGKVREIRELLAGLSVRVLSLDDIPPLPETEEPHDTFTANAAEKALAVARASEYCALADDSGLCVDALDGAPGVKSARVAHDDPARIAWLLERLSGVPVEHRTAHFTCAVALASPDGSVETWEATAEGVIADMPVGENGFGYDPVFIVPVLGKTFAQLSASEKNAISHRGKALRLFRADFVARLADE